MTRDEIIHMVEKAGCGWTNKGTEPVLIGEAMITTFADIVAAAEREACAEIADEYEHQLVAGSCARDIRARGDA